MVDKVNQELKGKLLKLTIAERVQGELRGKRRQQRRQQMLLHRCDFRWLSQCHDYRLILELINRRIRTTSFPFRELRILINLKKFLMISIFINYLLFFVYCYQIIDLDYERTGSSMDGDYWPRKRAHWERRGSSTNAGLKLIAR